MDEFRQKFNEEFLKAAYKNRQLFTREVLEEIKKYLQAKEINAVYKIPRSLKKRIDRWKCDIYPFKGEHTVTVPVDANSTSVSTLFLIQNMAI